MNYTFILVRFKVLLLPKTFNRSASLFKMCNPGLVNRGVQIFSVFSFISVKIDSTYKIIQC